ncbi:MAG TPA: tetratricopeptide repeat protein, partial [Parafilimonas sp.]|nr:tetratricopeptide repeat protein [Parafilimonas sp.]
MKFLSLVLYFSLMITSAFSQDSYFDSLKKILPTARDDTNKVYAYSDIAYSYQWSNPDSALLYALPGLALARKLNFERGEYDLILPITEALSLKGNYPQALKFRFRSIELAYRLKDPTKIANSLALTGNVYTYSNEYGEALKYLYRAKNTNAVTLGGPKVLNVMIGKAYFLLQKWDSAFVYIQKAYDLDQADTNDRWTEPPHYLAALYEQKGDLVKALGLYKESLTMGGANNSILQNYNGLASVYRKTGQTDSAIHYAKQAISLGITVSITVPVIEASALLVEIYKSQHNVDSAFKYQEILLIVKDSLFSQDKIKQLQNVTFDEQIRQQEVSIEKEKYESRIKLYALVAALTVFITIGGYSFYRYRRRRKLQSEQEMLNERLRISRELHDDMGSTLGSISIYSEVAKNRSAKNENADEVILKIGAASRELIDKMSDIVWSINPNNESLEQLQNR